METSIARGNWGALLAGGKQSHEVVGVVCDLKNGIGVRQSVTYLPLTGRVSSRSQPYDHDGAIGWGDGCAERYSQEIASIDPNLTGKVPSSSGKPACQTVHTASDRVRRRLLGTQGGMGPRNTNPLSDSDR